MTENQIRKLDGKRVRVKIHSFPHSVKIEEYTGEVQVISENVRTIRMTKVIDKTHYGFYIDGNDGKLVFIPYNMLKWIVSCEEVE